jgi:hypothetical protein
MTAYQIGIGTKVEIWSLFNDKSIFEKTKVSLYGKQCKVSFYCIDLLWGASTLIPIRFVLSIIGDHKAVFACTDLSADPLSVIINYTYRFKIETMFKSLKQDFSGLLNHFWTKSMPKLQRGSSAKFAVDSLAAVTDPDAREHIIDCFRRCKAMVMISCIAMGIVQLISLKFHGVMRACGLRWLRTESNTIPSEATTIQFMRRHMHTWTCQKSSLSLSF